MMSKYLEMGPIVKVKRLKDVIVTSAEFQQHIDIIGRVKHKNCAAVVAYYFSKGEVLMVYDYYNEGSLFALLHGNVAARDPLSWNTLLKIALTTAKGVSHIHKLHASKLVHGNVRSSNIVLDGSNCAIISDTALSKVMKPIKYWPLKHQSYIAPEVKDTSYMSQAADVYSFGVVLLELLTRKLARETWNDDGLFSLVKWVQNHVRAGTCFEVV